VVTSECLIKFFGSIGFSSGMTPVVRGNGGGDSGIGRRGSTGAWGWRLEGHDMAARNQEVAAPAAWRRQAGVADGPGGPQS
jgi:hypothetical protein